MQFVTRVAQHLGDPAAIESLQAVAKGLADLLGAHALLTRQRFVMLVDVVVLQPLKRHHRIVQARRGHAPCTNGRPHQVHGLVALQQPFAKNKAVQRTKDQPFGSTRRTRDDANVLGPQTVFADVGQGLGASVDVEGLHGVYFLRPCSLAKALAMAEPVPAGGEV